jgi:flagella basal body P-ring formation protein FlgA
MKTSFLFYFTRMVVNGSTVFFFFAISLSFGQSFIVAESKISSVKASQFPYYPLAVFGKENVEVATNRVRLNDIVTISSEDPSFKERIKNIQESVIREFNDTSVISIRGEDILEFIAQHGIAKESIGYSLPNMMTIKREYKLVSQEALKLKIKEYFTNLGREIEVISVDTFNNSIGEEVLESTELYLKKSLKDVAVFTIRKQFEDAKEQSFDIQVQFREYRHIPIAGKVIAKGNVVNEGDLLFAKMDISKLDTILAEKDEVLGTQAARNISYGEPFLINSVLKPALVNAGRVVVVQYIRKNFEATAYGVALDSGHLGNEVRVRNESSKKIIRGKVTGEGYVRVN